jgi:hypothetical protein
MIVWKGTRDGKCEPAQTSSMSIIVMFSFTGWCPCLFGKFTNQRIGLREKFAKKTWLSPIFLNLQEIDGPSWFSLNLIIHFSSGCNQYSSQFHFVLLFHSPRPQQSHIPRTPGARHTFLRLVGSWDERTEIHWWKMAILVVYDWYIPWKFALRPDNSYGRYMVPPIFVWHRAWFMRASMGFLNEWNLMASEIPCVLMTIPQLMGSWGNWRS